MRERLRSPGLTVAPGVFDPYSALLIENLGFPALYLGGNALGLQLGIGQPFVTLTETADMVARIRRVARLPVVVDAGAGFGDAAHAALAVQTLLRAGAGALHIDDQLYPKRAHYHRGRGRLTDVATMCGKLDAMIEARAGHDFAIICRTDALRTTKSIEQTITRCRSYADCGIDMLMVLDLGIDQAARFRDALPDLPLAWIGGIAEPVPSTAELEAAGFSLAVYPFTSTAAMTEALLVTWRALLTDGRPARGARAIPQTLETALQVVGLQRYLDIEGNTTEKPGA